MEVGPGAGSVTDLTTWLFEDDSFAPMAKLTAQDSYSVLTDHLGTPLELYDQASTTTSFLTTCDSGLSRLNFGTFCAAITC